MVTVGPKKWGKGEFWGLNSDYDHDWFLTDEQKILRDKLIELCRVKIRPHAIQCDRTYEYPRQSLDAMAELGLLGLIIPKEFGGLGQNHVGAAMVVETLARYGCPSTAMVYVMHLVACSGILFRHTNNPRIQNLMKRMDTDKLVGTICQSDPATGGHSWCALSSKVQMLDQNTVKLLRYGSWVTGAGHADWYAVETLSPDFKGDFSNMSFFLVYKDEVRASTDDWSALGMHGNQSGPLIVEGEFSLDRLIGKIGEGAINVDESMTPYFMLLTSGCWNGISLAAMDLAKKHVTRKAHADVGIRVCDYPTIQDYFGDCLSSTSVSRSHVFAICEAMDKATNNNDWSLHSDPEFTPRKPFSHWSSIAKYVSSKNVTHVVDTMLHACGGSGYKTDLGLERLLRDGKAGWLMSPSNEFIKQFLGKSCLMGIEANDLWEQNCNERVLHHEIGKMDLKEKKALAQKLMEEVGNEESGKNVTHPFQDTDFENPFNTAPPHYVAKTIQTGDGKSHSPGLNPSKFTSLQLASRTVVSQNMSSFVFKLPNPTDHTGCLPGQYIQVKVNIDGKIHKRYFSPVSDPNTFGIIELVLKFETHGVISKFFKSLKPGDEIDVIGPCGGFEYEPNQLDEVTLIASGGGITPGMQLIRCIMKNPSDKTRINLLYYSDTCEDILYKEELDTLAVKDSRLRIVYTLGEVPENWEGEEGFIDTNLIAKHVTKPNGIKHKIVLCGGPTMSIACLHSLRCLKFPSELIFIYGQFGTEQIRTVFGRNVKLSGHRCDNVV